MEEVGVVAPVTAVFEGTAPLTMEVGVVAPVTAGFYGFLLPFSKSALHNLIARGIAD